MTQNKKQKQYNTRLDDEKTIMKQSYPACFGSEGTPILNTRLGASTLAYFRKRRIVGGK